MPQTENNYATCSQCENKVNETDDFCPNCGSLFIDDAYCINHSESLAEGVCVICAEPFCFQCGNWVNDKFLCADHAEYEIYQGMARVYGINDQSQAEYVKGCLEEAGLHPFIYSRIATPWHSGTGNDTLLRSS